MQELLEDSLESDAPQLNRDLERWLNDIPHEPGHLEGAAQSNGTCWVYKLKATPTTGKWLLEIHKARKLKDGRLQDIRSVLSPSEALMREPGYLTELDLRIARLLVAIHSSYSFYNGYPLQGSSGAEVLQLALKTSKLYLDFENPQPLVAGEQRSAQFAWAEQTGGSFRPQWRSEQACEETILALEPLHYLDREQMEVGLLQTGLDEKLACHLSLVPDIPSRQATQFSHRMGAVTRVVPSPHVLTERVVDDIEPQAILTLASARHLKNWKYEPEHRAGLAFSYNGHVAADKKSTELLNLSTVKPSIVTTVALSRSTVIASACST